MKWVRQSIKLLYSLLLKHYVNLCIIYIYVNYFFINSSNPGITNAAVVKIFDLKTVSYHYSGSALCKVYNALFYFLRYLIQYLILHG